LAARQEYPLEAGDTLFIPGGVDHTYMNRSGLFARLLGATLRTDVTGLAQPDEAPDGGRL
jgi:quercetin dioxygenase-like cupin family protein